MLPCTLDVLQGLVQHEGRTRSNPHGIAQAAVAQVSSQTGGVGWEWLDGWMARRRPLSLLGRIEQWEVKKQALDVDCRGDQVVSFFVRCRQKRGRLVVGFGRQAKGGDVEKGLNACSGLRSESRGSRQRQRGVFACGGQGSTEVSKQQLGRGTAI